MANFTTFPIDEIRDVIEYARQHGVRAAADEFVLDYNRVYNWLRHPEWKFKLISNGMGRYPLLDQANAELVKLDLDIIGSIIEIKRKYETYKTA